MEQQTQEKDTCKDILDRVKEVLGSEEERKYYVVEVNKGIYLYKSRDAGYYFTDDVMNASKYLDAKKLVMLLENQAEKHYITQLRMR